MYMMIGDAAMVQAQLNRLNFCILINCLRLATARLQAAQLFYLQPSNSHRQRSIININMVWRLDGVLWFVWFFRVAAVLSDMLVISEHLTDISMSIVALISFPCAILYLCVYACKIQYITYIDQPCLTTAPWLTSVLLHLQGRMVQLICGVQVCKTDEGTR